MGCYIRLLAYRSSDNTFFHFLSAHKNKSRIMALSFPVNGLNNLFKNVFGNCNMAVCFNIHFPCIAAFVFYLHNPFIYEYQMVNSNICANKQYFKNTNKIFFAYTSSYPFPNPVQTVSVCYLLSDFRISCGFHQG